MKRRMLFSLLIFVIVCLFLACSNDSSNQTDSEEVEGKFGNIIGLIFGGLLIIALLVKGVNGFSFLFTKMFNKNKKKVLLFSKLVFGDIIISVILFLIAWKLDGLKSYAISIIGVLVINGFGNMLLSDKLTNTDGPLVLTECVKHIWTFLGIPPFF